MDPDEMIGASLGSYKVTSKLGQGGMGAVYLAEHPVLGRKAAIKVLLPELCQHKDAVERFFHEARTTAHLRHPAMVDVFDFGSLPDGRAFLIMDYLEGDCLEERIVTRGPLPVRQALEIARQIALGVSVAHAEEIVHRDLKPENIFLLPPLAGSRDERVKILDFGIAKLARKAGGAALTLQGTVMGTPLYMSPEQCRGELEVDHRADVYSLGCILFTMLTSHPPFVSDSVLELIGLHQHEPPPRLADVGVAVDSDVEYLVATMLAKAPAARVQSMLAVAEIISGLLARDEAQLGAARIPDSRVSETLRPLGGKAGAPPRQDAPSLPPTVLSRPRPNSPPASPRTTRWRAIRRVATVAVVTIIAGGLTALALRNPAAPPPSPSPSPVRPRAATSVPPPRVQPPAVPVEEPPAHENQVMPQSPAGAITTPAAAAPVARPARPHHAGSGSSAASRRSESEAGRSRPGPVESPRPSRPIYKGTKLDIDRQVPY